MIVVIIVLVIVTIIDNSNREKSKNYWGIYHVLDPVLVIYICKFQNNLEK